jgi:hypothetical protein
MLRKQFFRSWHNEKFHIHNDGQALFLEVPRRGQLSDFCTDILSCIRGEKIVIRELMVNNFELWPRVLLLRCQAASRLFLRNVKQQVQRAYPKGIDLGRAVGFHLYRRVKPPNYVPRYQCRGTEKNLFKEYRSGGIIDVGLQRCDEPHLGFPPTNSNFFSCFSTSFNVRII